MLSQRGFTLIELIAVMVIIGVLAVFALGRLDFTTTFAQKGFYDKVMSSLQFARNSAVAERRYVCVSSASNAITFKIDTRTPETAGAVFCDGSSEQNLAMAAADANCSGATNAVCAPSNITLTPSTTLIFDANGRNTTSSGSSGATQTFTATGQPVITVEAETGYVH